jgi:excisionase family DNA binding protein
MSTRTCPICGTTEVYDGDWPVCGCDKIPGLTLTIRQAAAYLCMSRSGVYHLIDDGYLAAIRGSRPLRVRMATVKCYLAGLQTDWWQHWYRHDPPTLRSVP